MATTPNGIMALPENDEMGAPQLSLNESYDAMRQGLKNARPDASADVDSTMAEILPQLEEMPDEIIDKLLQTVQYLKDNPDQYAEAVAKLISMGVVKEGDFPPEYDPEFLATMGIVLLETQRSRSEAPAQPTGFAKGGIADAARIMAAQGRGQDSMLAHITPSEARLLRSRGGMKTRNPSTGLPEYGFFDDLWSGVKGAVTGVFDAVKGVLKSPIGRVLGTIALGAFLGPGAFGITGMGLGAAAAPLASGIISGLSGGSAMDMLTSAATSYLGSAASPLSQYVGKMTSGLELGATASQALTSGLVGTGVGLLTGKSLEDSVSSGLQGAAINAAMAQLNAGKAPVPETDRAPVRDAIIKPVPGGSGSNVGLKPPDPPAPSPAAASSAAASSAAPLPAAASAGYDRPSLTDSIGKMFTPGSFIKGAEETFFPSGPTEDQVLKSSQFKAFKDQGFSPKDAFEKASSSMSPNMFRQYGPLVAAGLGATAAFGGFEPQKLEKSAQYNSLTGGPGSAKDLRSKNPRKYDLQGLPGVMYSPEGAIIGYRSPSGVESLYAKGGAVKSARKTNTFTNTMMPLPQEEEVYRTLPINERDFFIDPIIDIPYTPYNNTDGYSNLMNPTKYVRPPAKALPSRPPAAEYGYRPTRPPVARPEPLRPPVPPQIGLFPNPMPSVSPRELTKEENDAAARVAMQGQAPGRMGSKEALAAFRREQERIRSGVPPTPLPEASPVSPPNSEGPVFHTGIDQYGRGAQNGFNVNTPPPVTPPAALPIERETIIDAAATPPPALQKLPAAATATPPRMVQISTNSRGKPIYGPEAAPAAPASGGIMSLNNAGASPNEGRESPYGASERDSFGSGGGDGDGGGSVGMMAKGGYINKRAPYKPRGDVANDPVWGPGGMVYPSRSIALAMGVPESKIFKTAFEAYQGKANVAPTPVPPTPVPPTPVPPTPVPPTPVAPPIIIDGPGGDGNAPNPGSGGLPGYGAYGNQGALSNFLSNVGLTSAGQAVATDLGNQLNPGLTLSGADISGGQFAPGKGTTTQDTIDATIAGLAPGINTGTNLQGQGSAQTGLYGDAAAGMTGGIGSLSTGTVNPNAGELGNRDPVTISAYDSASNAVLGNISSLGSARNARAADTDAAQTVKDNADNPNPSGSDVTSSTPTGPSGAPPGGGDVKEGSLGVADVGVADVGVADAGVASASADADADAGADVAGAAKGGYIGSYAQGGMMGSNGIASLLQGGYPRKIGEIAGPGTGTSDDIPAMLSDGEFVMTAKAVRGAGKGSRRDGAKRMYALMHQLERNAARG